LAAASAEGVVALEAGFAEGVVAREAGFATFWL